MGLGQAPVRAGRAHAHLPSRSLRAQAAAACDLNWRSRGGPKQTTLPACASRLAWCWHWGAVRVQPHGGRAVYSFAESGHALCLVDAAAHTLPHALMRLAAGRPFTADKTASSLSLACLLPEGGSVWPRSPSTWTYGNQGRRYCRRCYCQPQPTPQPASGGRAPSGPAGSAPPRPAD